MEKPRLATHPPTVFPCGSSASLSSLLSVGSSSRSVATSLSNAALHRRTRAGLISGQQRVQHVQDG